MNRIEDGRGIVSGALKTRAVPIPAGSEDLLGRQCKNDMLQKQEELDEGHLGAPVVRQAQEEYLLEERCRERSQFIW